MLKSKAFVNCAFEVKEVKRSESGNTVVEGYASVFGNEDSYGEVVESGAFQSTINDAKRLSRVKVCLYHDMRYPIAKPEVIREDNRGLYVRFEILPTSYGKDAMILVDAGVLNEMSIGYYPLKRDERDGVVYLSDVDLVEFSLVTRAANEEAVVTSVAKKSEEIKQDISELSDKELTELKHVVSKEFSKRVINNLNK